MDWWQELLVYIGAASLGLWAGLLVLLLVFKVWPWYYSRKRKASISDDRPNKFDILVKKSRNRYREGIPIITAPAKSEGQTLSLAYENKHPVTKQETNLQANACPEEISRRMVELAASARRLQDIRAKIQMQIEQLSREEAVQVAGKVVKKAEQAAKIVRKTQEVVIAGISRQVPGLNEIETNLRIATTPWDGKPLPFQTKIWDTKMVEFDSLVKEHGDELGQAYIDMAMANHIVWFCTEIGYASDDLEASYKQLCTKIAERLAAVFGKRLTTCHA